MLSRLPVVLGLASLVVLLASPGCSSSARRDQNYGTDAGLDFQIPDAVTSFSQPAADTGSAADVENDTGLDVLSADSSAQEAGPSADSSEVADSSDIGDSPDITDSLDVTDSLDASDA